MNDMTPIGGGGIRPSSFDEVARLAKVAVMAGLIKMPKGRKDDEDGGQADDTKLQAMGTLIIMQGLEVGLSPMASLNTIALINGRPLIHGDAIPALLWARGFKIDETLTGTGDQRVATCTIVRPDGTKIVRSFSVADAKKAKLWDTREKVERGGRNGKWMADNDAPWFRFPDRMLAMRARGFAVKDGASDVTRGLYLREEYSDEANAMVDVTPRQEALPPQDTPPAPPSDDVPPAPPEEGPPAPPAEDATILLPSESTDPDVDITERTLEAFGKALEACETMSALDAICNTFKETRLAKLDDASQKKARQLKATHVKRLKA